MVLFLTVEHGSAVLSGGGQGKAGAVKLVSIVTDADLKLDAIVHVLEEGGRVERSKQRILSLPHEFLQDSRRKGEFSCF